MTMTRTSIDDERACAWRRRTGAASGRRAAASGGTAGRGRCSTARTAKRAANSRQPGEEAVEQVEGDRRPTSSARKNSRRSTPHSVSGRWSALYTTRISGSEDVGARHRAPQQQPGEELHGEEREAAAEDDAAIWRLAPPSPYMNIRPPSTIATSASERASGPVNEISRLAAARSQGDCASASAGEDEQRSRGEHAESDQERGRGRIGHTRSMHSRALLDGGRAVAGLRRPAPASWRATIARRGSARSVTLPNTCPVDEQFSTTGSGDVGGIPTSDRCRGSR